MLLRETGRMAPRDGFRVGSPKGLAVNGLSTGIFKGWRRPVGWVASYALVLQLVIGALAGAQVSAQAAGQNWSFFEICFGKGASPGELPEGVPDKPTSKCASCVLAATGGAVLAPEAVDVAAPAFIISEAVRISREDHLARFDASSSQRQRAPPFPA
jgi:hypothetical protein